MYFLTHRVINTINGNYNNKVKNMISNDGNIIGSVTRALNNTVGYQ